MSSRPIGLTSPEIVLEGEQFEIGVSGTLDPAKAKCRIVDVQNYRTIATPALTVSEGELRTVATVSQAGIYRLELSYGGESPLTQLVMVLPPEAT